MSTVPEVIVAGHQGMRTIGISIITDQCLPDALEPADIGRIIATAGRAEPQLTAAHRRAGGAGGLMAYPSWPDLGADQLEQQLLARWKAEGLFRQTLEAGRGGPPFVFYEGPPTANGRPGIHHVFARTIKDLICRYHAMLGQEVTRIAGWDTHGLPVEIEVEKELKLNGKKEIERFGVAEFNARARASVFKYQSDWETLSDRIGYWLDYEHPYVTCSKEYIETVWWLLRRLRERDLLVSWPPRAAVLPPLRHGALEPRARARATRRSPPTRCT